MSLQLLKILNNFFHHWIKRKIETDPADTGDPYPWDPFQFPAVSDDEKNYLKFSIAGAILASNCSKCIIFLFTS